MALFLGGMVNVVLHFVSASAFFLGVLENSAAFELEGFDEFEKLLVVGLSFAGEACDKGGTNREIWNALAHALKKVSDVSSIRLTVHLSEHVIGDVLKRNVHVAGDFGAFCDGLDELV